MSQNRKLNGWNRMVVVVLVSLMASQTLTAQGNPATPTVNETLKWLHDTIDEGGTPWQTIFEGTGCAVTITDKVERNGPVDSTTSFSLADIDPDIKSGVVGGEFLVSFHTTDFRKKIKKIIGTSNVTVLETRYAVSSRYDLAPRIAKALETAVRLCGGKPSKF